MLVWLRACDWASSQLWLIGNSPVQREHSIHTSEIGNLLGASESFQDCEFPNMHGRSKDLLLPLTKLASRPRLCE
jgi:hypothetical protein